MTTLCTSFPSSAWERRVSKLRFANAAQVPRATCKYPRNQSIARNPSPSGHFFKIRLAKPECIDSEQQPPVSSAACDDEECVR